MVRQVAVVNRRVGNEVRVLAVLVNELARVTNRNCAMITSVSLDQPLGDSLYDNAGYPPAARRMRRTRRLR